MNGGKTMIDLQAYLEDGLKKVVSAWNERDIYAISFFIYSNEGYRYSGYKNVTEFHVSYNTESDCDGADGLSEERWNYAFWRQDEVSIFSADKKSEGMKILFDWYREKGIDNIGYEDEDACYDNCYKYIGKGPVGLCEMLSEVTAVAQKLQESGFIKNKFGRSIPIIIHDLEYAWYMIEATKTANQNGEADDFLAAMKELGIAE